MQVTEQHCQTLASIGWRIVMIVRKCDDQHSILTTYRKEVRQLGLEAFECLSHYGMMQVFYFVQQAWANMETGPHDENHFHPRELEMAWDGIGAWKD